MPAVSPAKSGEVHVEPPAAEWPAVLKRNLAASTTWPSELRAERARARTDVLGVARDYTSSIGLSAVSVPDDAPLALTGHQPEFFHPGVWIKSFLLERLTSASGACGVNLVVDTDVAGSVAFKVPRLDRVASTEVVRLIAAQAGVPWVDAVLPTDQELTAFNRHGLDAIRALGVPVLADRFSAYCDGLRAALGRAGDLGMLMTMARRSYEAQAHTTYLELPVSVLARTASFRRFTAGLLLDAPGFRDAMNAALGEYRTRTHARSAAQPFPDLTLDDDRTEAPFWFLAEAGRLAVSVDERLRVFAGGQEVVALPRDLDDASDALAECGRPFVPRALTLTLFARLFLGDLFIHGTGGARYDRVTDDVISAYYCVEPPAYCIGSMTSLLPLGVQPTTDEDVAAAERHLKRFEHNPDELLAVARGLSAQEAARLENLAQRKAELIAALGTPGADRKSLGLEVRAVNGAIADGLRSLGDELKDSVDRTRVAREAWAVLGDRTYPFFLWDPLEIQACAAR